MRIINHRQSGADVWLKIELKSGMITHVPVGPRSFEESPLYLRLAQDRVPHLIEIVGGAPPVAKPKPAPEDEVFDEEEVLDDTQDKELEDKQEDDGFYKEEDDDSTKSYSKVDLEAMRATEVRELAKEMGLNVTGRNKDSLIRGILRKKS